MSGNNTDFCSSCSEVCDSPLVNYLLCAREEENTNCLSPETLQLTLNGGVAAIVLLAFSIILLQVTVCGLGWKIKSLKKSRRQLDLTLHRNSAYEGVLMHKKTTDGLDEVKTEATDENETDLTKDGQRTVGDEINNPPPSGQESGDYEKVHNKDYNKPAEIPINAGSAIQQSSNIAATLAPPSLPLLDDYSTISDILAANSVASKVSTDDIPAYEVVKKSPVSLKRLSNLQDDVKPDDKKEVSSPTRGLMREIPLYSEVNLELKRSREALDEYEVNGVVEKETVSDDIGKEIPLYSVVNLELKSSRQALDEIEEFQGARNEGAKDEDTTLDDVINDFSRLAEGLPLMQSPSPPPIPPPLHMADSPPNLYDNIDFESK